MLTFSPGSESFKDYQTMLKLKQIAMKKNNCSGKCSYKVKTNDYNKSTSERALLLVEPQTNGLQLN